MQILLLLHMFWLLQYKLPNYLLKLQFPWLRGQTIEIPNNFSCTNSKLCFQLFISFEFVASGVNKTKLSFLDTQNRDVRNGTLTEIPKIFAFDRPCRIPCSTCNDIFNAHAY